MSSTYDDDDYFEEGDSDYEREMVAKGANLLDTILPGWYKEIDLKQLEMSDGTMCMMGQLFGTGVESKLAETMYPKEMQKARGKGDTDWDEGYSIGLCLPGGGVVGWVINKLGLKDKMKQELMALDYVCDGHDTKCFWAEQIADRIAKDGEAGTD